MKDSTYPNETIRVLLERGSCRSFADRDIEPDVLESVLRAGVHAPTAGNLQPYSVILIKDKNTSLELQRLCGNQAFISQAPVNLLFCLDWNRIRRWTELEAAPFSATQSFRHFWVSFQDTIICAQNIVTAADSLGLGSVYVGTVLECFAELREMFNMPQAVFPVVLLSLGYPKHKPVPRRKLGIDTIVHHEKYHDPDDASLLQAFSDKYALEAPLTPSESSLQTIGRVAESVHGQEFARRCVERISETGVINRAQRYFGLHYRADIMPTRNRKYLEIMRESGFDWFEHS